MIWAFLAGVAVIPALILVVCLLEWTSERFRINFDRLLLAFSIVVGMSASLWITQALLEWWTA